MPTYEAIVEESGKVQLPDALVRKLRIKPGHRVEFFETVDGEVFFHAIAGTTQGWKGMFGAPARRPPISIREMDEGIADYLSEKHERIKRQ
jgi:bifunctional DNA-binding transcriptional regulator/antitoxin component of YhaV-PrlF toxin-antitoxin module